MIGNRRRISLLLAATLFSCATLPALAAPASGPQYAAILINPATKEVLYANGADRIGHPASITKIMTLFIAFDEISAGRLKLTDRVPISRFAASQRPSR